MTDMYLDTVERAVARPGHWIEIPRRFDTEFNASITAACLREGYPRVHQEKATSRSACEESTTSRPGALLRHE